MLKTSRGCHRGLAVAAAMVAAAFMAATANAADVRVGAGACGLHNGQATVPAGSTVTVRSGEGEVNRGNLVSFLNAQTTTVSVNGGSSVDYSASYTAPEQRADGAWISVFDAPTGVTLANPGDTMRFILQVTLSRPLAEVTNGFPGYEPGKPIISAAGIYEFVDCTVTAV